ncbi:hypothetical protein [Cellulomonas sp. Y8]|uniref:hypothetical protein n=1 Tax=Cellulomonas sp. Y8 TaxID=2591145 RepID=UPI0011C884C7|nr:hypothetical protein [Cellulomonas sp. Y8]
MTVLEQRIDPRIDIYGGDGRSGALADFVEFRALNGVHNSVADLADLVKDMGWSSRPLRQIITTPDDEGDDPDSMAEQAFGLLAERLDVLQERYPFEFRSGRLYVRALFDVRESSYIQLLAITMAHAWKLDSGEAKPTEVLEFVVRDALTTLVPAVSMGTADRNGKTFKENLRESASALGLTATPNPTPIRVKAKDAGVDTLAGQVWRDGRPGHWVFIGQVTCGQTGTWAAKLGEPKSAIWRDYLQERLLPQRFLAVPHHVDARVLYLLHSSEEGVVLDRLRLVLMSDSVVPQAAPVIDCFLSASA